MSDRAALPKRRGRPPTVTRDSVVDAAMRLALREGLDRFTMAQLAAELGMAPMSAYHHVANREELVGLVVGRVLETVEIPSPESGTWQQRLKALEADVRHRIGALRGTPTGDHLARSPGSNRVVDAVFDILRDAGFDDATATRAFGALFTYMIGQLDLDQALRSADPDDRHRRFEELVERVGPEPTVADDVFDFGFDLLLTGLAALVPATATRPTAQRGGASLS